MINGKNEIASLFTPSPLPQKELHPHHFTVGELIQLVKSTVETDFYEVFVVGEISSFKPWRSGHWYFDLKDKQALLPAIMFRSECAKVQFELKEGMSVQAKGRLSVYPPQSKLQFIVDTLEPLGAGALALAFEQLKKKLEAEGLFSPSNKKKLPLYPSTVGIVTSPQGAALQDMLRILKNRHKGISLLISPTRVQGEGSAKEIAHALKQLDATQRCDVIIIARGGGSLEDLWAFNEEMVARAIFACSTPIISAVGHETDFTIADFVSDKRCATPSHAAQEVTPSFTDLYESVLRTHNRLTTSLQNRYVRCSLILEKISKKLKDPKLLLLKFSQRLDLLEQRLQARAPLKELARRKTSLALLKEKLKTSFSLKQEKKKEKLRLCAVQLAQLSPLNVLGRGYSAIYSTQPAQVVTSLKQIEIGQELRVQLKDGHANAQVTRLFPNSIFLLENNPAPQE